MPHQNICTLRASFETRILSLVTEPERRDRPLRLRIILVITFSALVFRCEITFRANYTDQLSVLVARTMLSIVSDHCKDHYVTAQPKSWGHMSEVIFCNNEFPPRAAHPQTLGSVCACVYVSVCLSRWSWRTWRKAHKERFFYCFSSHRVYLQFLQFIHI